MKTISSRYTSGDPPMIIPRRSQAWYVDGSRSGILAWLINSGSVPLEKKSTPRMTERGDLSPLQPLPRTPNARCGNAGGCQRRECKTACGTPRLSEDGISHSSPIAAAAETRFDSFLAMPGQFFVICAAKTPAYPIMIPDATRDRFV